MEFNATKASVTQVYNTYTLGLGKGLVNITSFWLHETDHPSARKMFITNSSNYIYFVGINTTDYSVIHAEPFWF